MANQYESGALWQSSIPAWQRTYYEGLLMETLRTKSIESAFLERSLSPAMHDLILYIRTGCQYIDVLTIHNGQPTCAETDFKINGLRCRKKVRFPAD